MYKSCGKICLSGIVGNSVEAELANVVHNSDEYSMFKCCALFMMKLMKI